MVKYGKKEGFDHPKDVKGSILVLRNKPPQVFYPYFGWLGNLWVCRRIVKRINNNLEILESA